MENVFSKGNEIPVQNTVAGGPVKESPETFYLCKRELLGSLGLPAGGGGSRPIVESMGRIFNYAGGRSRTSGSDHRRPHTSGVGRGLARLCSLAATGVAGFSF